MVHGGSRHEEFAMFARDGINSEPPAGLEGEDLAPFEFLPGNVRGGMVIICDHATNRLPARYGTLGLPRREIDRHIGFDIGAEPLTRLLARRMDLPAVISGFSRLLIDPNRGLDDPTLIPAISDGTVIAGNAGLDEAEKARRIARFYRPYHEAIEEAVEAGIAAGRPPAIFSVHSFTPVWRGVSRPWHVGVLWDRDPRLARPLIEALREDPRLVVGDNEPYSGALRNDTLYRHGTRRGLAHALIEVRQDLVGDDEGVTAWADRLQPILERLLARAGINRIEHHGTRTGN